ncbi:alternative ribosome rescue aminoacyl-tRNA hydrolase ArfB [Roseiconus lacunae]|uniref:alternative ribosome rescue aminoacyl-tRNA hydrolase ArfB n=1 Tax=Roseiconus lacunae TaxID=2605694 RepID=UPI001E54E663|nr:alternative ribosome rescue aminoacyl-tRNA hydrolase ArfB [Roseiconus lacunae]MCD0461193.1 aminoacyl-tRNA hydrolase [Roseiconus lacunae]
MNDLIVSSYLTLPAAEFTVTTVRSSGPGGQNVNKVNSKVILHWEFEATEQISDEWKDRFRRKFSNRINRDGALVLQSDRHREQMQNLAEVRAKLVEMLTETRRPPRKRKPTKPTAGSRRRRKEAKIQQSQKKQQRRQKFD